MRTKVTVVGDDTVLVIDRAVLDRLEIGPETNVELTVEGTRLTIESVASRRARISAAAERVMVAHASTFRRLAQ